MNIRKNTTSRMLLDAILADVESLRARIGVSELEAMKDDLSSAAEWLEMIARGWDGSRRERQDDLLRKHWLELLRIERAALHLKYRVGKLGRKSGKRIKLTDKQIAEIKAHGKKRGIKALAKTMEVSRQTIYNVLNEMTAATKQAIDDWRKNGKPIAAAELCRRLDISRQSLYSYLQRFRK